MVGTTECTPGYYNNEGRGWEDGVAAELMASGPTAWAAGAVIAIALALVVHFKGSWIWIK
jgi:hypothetical protein